MEARPVPSMPSIRQAGSDLSSAWFAASDLMRRAQGEFLASSGFGPQERPYRVALSGPFWRLRDYGGDEKGLPLLAVAAPIKRPYVWDMSPRASAVGYCLEQGLRVYLIEWTPASVSMSDRGLEDFVAAVGTCMAHVAADAGKPLLIGHSLGGTLAALCAAHENVTARGAVLLSAPTCFAPGTSRFRDALMAIVPRETSARQPYAGSLLSQMSALASPDAFVWERYWDALLSMTDGEARALHAGVERWALDEVPLPGKLVHQLVDWLYREDRFQSGTLQLAGRRLAPSGISIPLLAVVNRTDAVAPLTSVKPLLERLPADRTSVIEHDGEVGVGLQHLAILVGRKARTQVWPQIMAWSKSLD